MKKNTVIFDLFQVLVSFNPAIFYKRFIPDEARYNDFMKTVITPEFDRLKDILPDLKQVEEAMIAKYPDFAPEIKAYPDNEADMVEREISGTLDIVQDLKNKGIKLYLLSNINADTIKWAKKVFHFWDLFDGLILSGEVNMAKPDIEIFRYLLHKYKIKPEQAVFVDDNPANINAAKQAGIDGITFTSPAELKEELHSFGLL